MRSIRSIGEKERTGLTGGTIQTHPRQWPLGTSTALFPGGLTEERLVEAKAAGIECLEFVAKAGSAQGDDDYDFLADRARELGMSVWSVHLPFGRDRDISSTDAEVRRLWIEQNTQIMERAVKWGVAKAILHPSYEPISADERPERMRHAMDSLRRLADEADRLGVQIAVECLPRTCLGNTSEEILDLLDAHPSLGVCCDVNHLLHETPQAFIEAVGPHIVSLHFSDYDGLDEKHWLPGRGVIDWNAVLRALARAGYDGPFMYEVVNRKTEEAEPITPQRLAEVWVSLKESYDRDN